MNERPFFFAARLRRIGPAVVVCAVLLGVASAGAQQAQAGPAAAARQETAANARVVPGLAIQKTQDLDVGEVRAGATAGSVRVGAPSGSSSDRSASGGVALTGSTFSAAQFQVRGAGEASRVHVQLPASTTLSRVGGSETILVQDFQATITPTCSGPQCAAAPLMLSVGATLRIGADQVSGSYTGTFTVTVNEF